MSAPCTKGYVTSYYEDSYKPTYQSKQLENESKPYDAYKRTMVDSYEPSYKSSKDSFDTPSYTPDNESLPYTAPSYKATPYKKKYYEPGNFIKLIMD